MSLDILNQPLSVGDRVAFPTGNGSAGSMQLGEVIRIGTKMAIVFHNRREYRRYFSDLVKVPNT